MAKDKAFEDTKRLMGALMRTKPKPREESKASKSKTKR